MESAKMRVFVVDDDKMFATMLTDHLESQEKYAVSSFSTGEECLAHLDAQPDVVILDYFLDSEVPGAKNGLEILHSIKKADSDIKVIMLSAQERYGVALQTIAGGAVYYVIKSLESFKEIDSILADITS